MSGMRHTVVFLGMVLGCGGTVVEGTPSDASVDTGKVDAPPADTSRFDRCDGAAQCQLATTGCCGKCGEAVLTDFDAIARDQYDAHFRVVCPEPLPCPKCATLMTPNLLAFCRSERCVGIDVRADVLSECTKDDDCRLRAGNGCCENCAVAELSALIAVSKSKGGELEAQVCDPLAGACPPCVPVYPAGVAATCDPATRHCRVTVK